MDISSLKGVGPKTKLYLNELGIYNVQDLIGYYPFRFNVIKKTDESKMEDGSNVTISGVVEGEPTLFKYGRNKDRMNFRISTKNNIYNVVIFNRGFLRNAIRQGSTVTITGKYEKFKSNILASDIKTFDIGNKELIEPVYHSSSNISSRQIHKIIKNLFDQNIKINDKLPNYIISKYSLMPREKAVREIHFPTTLKALNPAINYLKYEEFFEFLKKINSLKMKNKKLSGIKRNISESEIEKFIDSLPFDLTKDQIKAVSEISADMKSGKVMNRLLQGDVSSGKTVVSFIALYINYLSNYQGALMAPTDVLARQHYKNIKEVFKNYDVKISLLTGKMSEKEKKQIKSDIKLGKTDIVIGTHALFSKDVEYKNLGLVITDEQHRFGVRQRGEFRKKGNNADVLYMTATPIPRTFALTIYGDMDVSSIKVMPKNRKPVKTFLKNTEEIKSVLEKVFLELQNDNQVYVVVPLIEETEKSDMKNVFDIASKFEKAYKGKFKVGVLHGKMTSDEKEGIMESFYKNDINILISTTVVEVGLDNPNATVMVVFDSDRFGLSTLHQLRGRVGRGSKESYFYMISKESSERLEVLTKTNDGFLISEHDFNERGSGDLFGVRQSGEFNFQIANIKSDFRLLKKVDEDVKEYLKTKENLI